MGIEDKKSGKDFHIAKVEKPGGDNVRKNDGGTYTPVGNLRKKKWLGRGGEKKPISSISDMRDAINRKFGKKKMSYKD